MIADTSATQARHSALAADTALAHRAARESAALFERPGSTLVEVTGTRGSPT